MPPPAPVDLPPTREERIAEAALGLSLPAARFHAWLGIEPLDVKTVEKDGKRYSLAVPGPMARDVGMQLAACLDAFDVLEVIDNKWVVLGTTVAMLVGLYEQPLREKFAELRSKSRAPEAPIAPIQIPQYEPERHQDDAPAAATC